MTEKDEGALLATIGNMSTLLKEQRDDMRVVRDCMTKTEERLAHGVGHFQKIDKKIDDHEQAIARMPTGKAVYTILGLGFTILGLIVAFVK
jgi:hypothetical protein